MSRLTSIVNNWKQSFNNHHHQHHWIKSKSNSSSSSSSSSSVCSKSISDNHHFKYSSMISTILTFSPSSISSIFLLLLFALIPLTSTLIQKQQVSQPLLTLQQQQQQQQNDTNLIFSTLLTSSPLNSIILNNDTENQSNRSNVIDDNSTTTTTTTKMIAENNDSTISTQTVRSNQSKIDLETSTLSIDIHHVDDDKDSGENSHINSDNNHSTSPSLSSEDNDEIDIETTTNAKSLMMFDKEEKEVSTTMIDETMTTTTTESVPISVLRKRKLDGHGTIDPSIDDTIDFSKRIMRIEKPEWLKKNNNEKDDDYDDDDDDDGDNDNDNNEESYESNPNSICTASYFFDRVIPDDYPHEISKDVKHINETIERLNRMYTFTNKMLERLNPFLREMVSRMSDYLYESQLDSDCMGALFRVFRAINQRETWAMNFLDASGSILVGGFQQGMFVSLGEFDQCLEIESDPTENPNIIYGQYCLLKPVVPLPENFNQDEPIAETRMPRVRKFLNDEYIDTYMGLYKFMQRTFLRVGLCLPHKCERQSVENAINRILVRKTGMSVQVGPECVKATDDPPLNLYQIIFISLFILLLLLVIMSTAYEIIYRHLFENRHTIPHSESVFAVHHHHHPYGHQQSTFDQRTISHESRVSKLYFDKPAIVQVLTSFSIIRNTRHLFDNPGPNRYPQLDTMRLLLIIFFFITNVYYYTMLFAPMIIKRFYVQGPFQFISEKKYFFIRMYYLIDVFVVFSGIALAISFKPKSFIYVHYLIRNYIRYTLPIIVSIGMIYVVPLFGSGPLWHLFDQTMTQPCKDNIWSALFFTNNFQNNIEDMCNLPTVFVSMIFQLKLLAPVILLINSYLNPRSGNIFHGCLLIMATIGNVIYRFYFNFKVPYEHRKMKSFMEIKQSVMFYLFNPFPHLQPLIIGLWVGHLIITQPSISAKITSGNNRNRSMRNAITGCLALIAFFTCFFFIENMNLMNPNLTTFRLTMMLTLGRPMLVGLHAWIIYSCITGHITIVNRFLSSIAFRPISKLSYGFFLTSIVVTCYRLFSIRQTIILSGQTMFRSIVSDAVISFFLAYYMHIMIQQPIRNLLQIEVLSSRIFPITKSLSSLSNTSDHTGTYYIRRSSSLTDSNQDESEFKQIEKTNEKNGMEFSYQNNGFITTNNDSFQLDKKDKKSSIMLDLSRTSSIIISDINAKKSLDLNHNSIVENESSKF
uniref:Nose resistant to fluoxetine protein 6-like n=1 Tax=Dermatophagoides pteronyssinus TaxID=6956 RepID=A0A6P6XKY2_DERPT|nr:nose resistant to fluoxetine protein 6-like [Dermatophagoides pteronyssinus]